MPTSATPSVLRIQGIKLFYVLAGGGTGGMFGALDVTEAIKCNTINQFSDSDNLPTW